MTRKSCCKMRNQLRIASSAAGAVIPALVVAWALVWFSPAVFADTVPEWMRTAAHETLPEYPKDTVAVVLLDDEQTTVKDNGEIETRSRVAYKLLRPEARQEYGWASVRFDNETKVSSFRGWTLTSDGKELEVREKDALEGSISSFEVFTDARFKTIKYLAADPGNVVGYELIQKHRPFVFEDSWDFQEMIPTRRARFSLQVPPGWEFAEYWANFPKQEPRSSVNNVYAWEVENIQGIEVEPEMPHFRTIAGRMDIKYFPRDVSLRAKTTGSWKDIGLWYAGLTSSSRVPSPALQQKVAALTVGMSDPLQKMQALASYVQQQIRYVAIEVGIGGLLPHPAADVFKHQYGDCKDKATLLSAMLKEAGIDSYYVMVDTHRGVVTPEFPSLYGNHMVMAIRLPDSVQDTRLYAIVNDPQLGRLLFFDPTNEFVPLGYLPNYLQENYGLVIAPEGGKLLLLPLLPSTTNRMMRTATLTLSSGGDLRGDVHELRWGGPAAQSRQEFVGSAPADRAKIFETYLGRFLSNFALTSATLGNLDQYDETLALDYKFQAAGYAKTAGDLLIVRPRVLGEKGSTILTGKARKYPIEFGEATLQTDTFDIALPAGYVVDELPQAVRVVCDYGTYKSDVEVKNNVLHFARSYEIKDLVVPTEKLAEVRDFFSQIAADEKSSAVLRKATP
jgi:transglutaminase-like putative cysteine protease